jgi:hypothetical protein
MLRDAGIVLAGGGLDHVEVTDEHMAMAASAPGARPEKYEAIARNIAIGDHLWDAFAIGREGYSAGRDYFEKVKGMGKPLPKTQAATLAKRLGLSDEAWSYNGPVVEKGRGLTGFGKAPVPAPVEAPRLGSMVAAPAQLGLSTVEIVQRTLALKAKGYSDEQIGDLIAMFSK